jgi:hypothetical protein
MGQSEEQFENFKKIRAADPAVMVLKARSTWNDQGVTEPRARPPETLHEQPLPI